MPSPVAVFRPSRWYAVFAALSATSAAICGWFAWILGAPAVLSSASVAWMVVSALFGLTALFSLFMLVRPQIVVETSHLVVRNLRIAWKDIVSLETGRWVTPLLLRLTLDDGQRVTILHSGNAATCQQLLHMIGRSVRNATLDGVPYDEVWAENKASDPLQADLLSSDLFDDFEEPSKDASPDLPLSSSELEPLLRPEDAEEVERLYQRLKKVGRLDQGPSEE